MPHSSSMPRFVTSIINDQPKSSLAFVNIRIPIVSGNRQTRSGKNDVPCNALVDYCDSREYEVQEKEYVTMESNETTHLIYGKSIYETIQLTDPKEALEDTGLISLFKRHKMDTRNNGTTFGRNLKFKFDQSSRTCSRICISITKVAIILEISNLNLINQESLRRFTRENLK